MCKDGYYIDAGACTEVDSTAKYVAEEFFYFARSYENFEENLPVSTDTPIYFSELDALINN